MTATENPESSLNREQADREPADRNYVAGLDGLRAVAVAAVILYHFARSRMPAGFLGVDVFFVVSGFLIARLLVGEVTRSGTISLARFWARRARRLLPALVTMVVVVLGLSAVLLSDVEMHDMRAHALGSLFYVSNWVFIHGDSSYFVSFGSPSPFLHTWSLAIEEQFYLVFPLVVLATRTALARRPALMATLSLGGAVASAWWMARLVTPSSDPSRAYYGSDSRAMGLLVGVALGIVAGAPQYREALAALADAVRPRWLPTAVGTAALAGVVATMWKLDDRSDALYHGGFLWFSLACGVLIAVLVLFPRTTLSRVMGAAALVQIGLRSYSLYLWHWPVRVFVSPGRTHLEGAGLFALRLLILVVLAELSYRFVEQPFRTGSIAHRTGARGAIVFSGALTLVAVLLVMSVARPQPLPPPTLALVRDASPDPDARVRVDVFGDSTALVFALSGHVHRQELGRISVGGDQTLGCGVVPADQVSDGRVIERPDECDGRQAEWATLVGAEPDAVVALMAGAWEVLDQRTASGTVAFGTDAWTELVTDSFRSVINTLGGGKRRVYVFDVPCYGGGDPDYPLPERHDEKRIAAVNAVLADLARENPSIELVPLRELVCPGGTRAEQLDGVALWESDGVHLTEAGSVAVWRWWLTTLPEAQ